MRYCEYCGTQLADNAACVCQGAQLAANQQAQQSGEQQPYAQNPYNTYPYNPTPYNANPYTPPQPSYPPVTNTVNNAPQPGRKMIKVSGILMTIFSSIALFSLITVLAMAPVIEEVMDDAEFFFRDFFDAYNYSYEIEFPFAAVIGGIFTSGMMLAFGIMGIAFSKKPERGTAVMVLGIIMLALLVISTGLTLTDSNGMIGSMVMTNIITGSVLPILYIVGGYRRRKSNV